MDLTLTDTQQQLAETARSFVSRSCPLSLARETEASEPGFDARLWKSVAELGWAGLLLPEQHGGAAQGLLEFVVLCEELGRGLFPSPLIPSSVLVASLLMSTGTREQQCRWLPSLAAGTAIATLARLRPGARDEWSHPTPESRRDAHGTVALSESRVLVPFAGAADMIVVTTRVEDCDALVALDASVEGLRCTRQRTLGGDPLYEVTLDDVRVVPEMLVPMPRAVLDRALDHAAIASLGYQVGAAERALEMTVEHAKTREQFGRPIGAFQAVAHRCADMRADIDACRYLAYQGAWALDHRPAADLEVAAAKAYGNEALRRVYMHAHQVHGAVGFSTEHDLQLFSRRAKAFELTYGGTRHHLARVAGAMGLA